MTLTFTLPNLPAERLLSDRWSQLSNMVRSARRTSVASQQRSTDVVTGLLTRSVFLDEASILLDTAARQRREVAVTFVLIEGIDTDGERYSESDANLLLRGGAAALSLLSGGNVALGRIGLAEFCRIELIESRTAAWRRHEDATALVGRSVECAVPSLLATSTLGMTLSRGRSIDMESLITEARRDRRCQNGAPVSAAS